MSYTPEEQANRRLNRILSGLCTRCGKNSVDKGVKRCMSCIESKKKLNAGLDKIEARRKQRLVKKYKITLREYERMLQEQEGHCKLCGLSPQSGQSLVVDHDHKTGKIRGLIHPSCNAGIGMFYDDISLLKLAIRYIEDNS